MVKMKLVFSIIILVLKSCVLLTEFSTSAGNFSIDILYHVQQVTDGHFVISPFGIWSLMTTVAVGAGGRSRSELLQALRLPQSQISIVNSYQKLSKEVLQTESDSVILLSHNFMFIDRRFTVNSEFMGTMRSDFNADIIHLDFGSPLRASEIANGVIKDTGASTSDVFNPDNFYESRFMLTNVINFKGLWKSPFNESNTRVEPFYDENKNKIGEANMMYKVDLVPFSNMQSLQSLILELPYGNDDKFCMIFILPHPKIKVTKAYQNLQRVSIKEIFDKLQQDVDEYGQEAVEIKLPRFKTSTNVVLNKPLMDMGVRDVFDQVSANFEYITDNRVFVSAVVHNANIEVTETGTTASAVTTAEASDRIGLPSFDANRPFIYLAIEKSSTTILFGGIYSKPAIF